MLQRRLGRCGLTVSAVGLGTMTWGRDTDELDAAEQLDIFLEAGGTLVDTAAAYSGGGAESILGARLAAGVRREDVVLVSKAGTPLRAGGGAIDNSRGSLLSTLDASLDRLGTDHLDLWLVQRPDPATQVEETLAALDFAVRSGRTRYVGLSNFPAWETTKAAVLARSAAVGALPAPGLAAVEVEYSLVQRGVERELLPAAEDLGLGVVAWSSLGRGVLAGRYRTSVPPSSRGASPHLRGFVEPYLEDSAASVVEAVATAAQGLGVSAAEVALAWVLGAPGMSSALVGASTASQLRQTLAGATLDLPDEIRDALDDVSAIEVGYPERL